MAGRVYSTRFISAVVHSSASGVAARFTVPAFKVAIVRTIDLTTTVAGDMYFGHFPTGGTNWWMTTTGAPALSTRHWDGRHVFTAGESFGMLHASGTSIVLASGYLLDAP